MKSLLITGATGFVGKNLSRYLLGMGYTVYGTSRTPERLPDGVQSLNELTAETLRKHNINTIIHLAGIAHDLSGVYQAADYDQVNAEQTIKLYSEFLKSPCSAFIFMSSIKAATDLSLDTVDESVTPNPVTPYGISKRKAEVFIETQVLPTGKRFYIFRPCMIHGPGNKGNLNLLYQFVKRGIPWPLGSFDNQRSFLGVDNLFQTMQSFIQNNYPSGIYHLADEGFISTGELVKLIGETIQKRISVLKIPKVLVRALVLLGGQHRRLQKLTENMKVSNQKLITTLGVPLSVSLRDGLRKTIRSFHE